MRTFLASVAVAAVANAATAHEGHGDAAALHGHGFDLLGIGVLLAALAWWLWQRRPR
jgi:hypothetical protein